MLAQFLNYWFDFWHILNWWWLAVIIPVGSVVWFLYVVYGTRDWFDD